jgi:uncharacterized protein (TIGR03067 family)
MRFRVAAIAAALIACSLTTLAVSQNRSAKNALAELQGVWRLTSIEQEGEARAFAERAMYWVIKGDKVFYDGKELAKLAADPSTTPRCLDLTFRSPKAEREGIYDIKDGTLRICVHWDADGVKERPQEFTTKEKPPLRLLAFRMVKDSEADAAKKGFAFIGIAIRKNKDGSLAVADTLPDSPAKKAGLKKDDQIQQVAGADVGTLIETVRAIREVAPGSELVIRIRRDGKEKDIKIKAELMPFHFLVQ